MIVDWCTYVNLKKSYSVLQLIPNMSKSYRKLSDFVGFRGADDQVMNLRSDKLSKSTNQHHNKTKKELCTQITITKPAQSLESFNP